MHVWTPPAVSPLAVVSVTWLVEAVVGSNFVVSYTAGANSLSYVIAWNGTDDLDALLAAAAPAAVRAFQAQPSPPAPPPATLTAEVGRTGLVEVPTP